MKKLFVLLIFIALKPNGHAQQSSLKGQMPEIAGRFPTENTDTLKGWHQGGTVNINTNQTSLTNWAAGGQSSVSFGGLLSLYAHYQDEKKIWDNNLDIGYGSMKQDKKTGWRKTDDKIDISSTFGLKATEKLYYALLLNFKTQMTRGYNYPDDSTVISKFLAPGYLLTSLGIEYKPGEFFNAIIAPFTLKMTFVNDDGLSDAGAFGVGPGKKAYSEFGGYIRLTGKKELMENIMFQTKLDLFSNYLNNPQYIDVNWETLLSMKVNQYISATLSTQLIYDHDIDIAIDENDDGIIDETGPRVQFKEVLAVGLSIIF